MTDLRSHTAKRKLLLSFAVMLALVLTSAYITQSPDPGAATQDFFVVQTLPTFLVPLEIVTVFAFYYINLAPGYVLKGWKKILLAFLGMFIAFICALFVSAVLNPWLIGLIDPKVGNELTASQQLFFSFYGGFELDFAPWITVLEFALCNLLVLQRINSRFKPVL